MGLADMMSVSTTIVFKMRIVKKMYREVKELLIVRRYVICSDKRIYCNYTNA